MSWQAATFVTQNSKHKGSYLLTLLMIANHAHADGTGAWPSIATLAKETRLSERGVQYCIQKLKESGELGVIPDGGPKGVNGYCIIGMTQTLRQSKSGMTQDLPAVTQENWPDDATAIAPKRNEISLERSAPSAPLSLPSDGKIQSVSQRLEDYYKRRWQTAEDGRRFLISPASGERVYEEAIH